MKSGLCGPQLCIRSDTASGGRGVSAGCLEDVWEGVVGDYERQLKVLVINMLDQAQNLGL